MIGNEKEVIEFLSLPSIPKKIWDGKTSFKNGVAVLNMYDGTQEYAIATYDNERQSKPSIKRVFSINPYASVDNIFVVPSYMDNNVDSMDLDEQSKKQAQKILDEAKELENEGVKEKEVVLPTNEWVFDHIQNEEQAKAYIRSYNISHGIRKGKVPNTKEGMIARLTAIWMEENKKNNK